MISVNNETDYKLIDQTRKLYIFFFISTLSLFIIIFLKLFFLTLEKDFKKEVVIKNPEFQKLPRVLDRNGNVLAYSDYNFSIYQDEERFAYLDRDAPITEIKKNIYIGKPSIKFEKILTRKYPYSEILNNLIGQVNIDQIGISLLENKVSKLDEDMSLSIDIQIQKLVYESLSKDVENLNPDYALSVIIDLDKEAILSNVYIDNSNKQFDESLLPLKDLTFEFGSVFKPFTVFSALNNNKLDLNEYFDVDQPVYIGDKLVKDFSPSKIPYQVKDILKQSSNRGAVLIRRKLDCQKEFKRDFENLGLLNSTDIGFEMYSANPIVNPFKSSYCDNIPFGYGLSVSPIQLINAYGKIITGRMDFQAHIYKNNKIKKNKFNNISNTLNKLLFYANESNEELYNNFLIAGKTGTADKKYEKGYFQNVTYVSYFPYNDPKYLSFTFMQNPRETYGPFMTAGNTVKHAFYNILRNIYMYLDLTILNTSNT